jgi:DNA-binding transcriptional LysR family regulator
MDKFRLIRCFLAVVDHGSYSSAARVLSASPSTVSKTITRLESNIGLQLFQRSTRQLQLTEEGKEYALQVRTLIEQLNNCESNIKRGNDLPRGKLRINVPISFGRLYIRPLLKPFFQLYPKINIELSYNDKYVDIIEQGFDVCIRSGSLYDSRLIVRQLCPIDFLVCASPSYLKTHKAPINAQQFSQHKWIRFRFQQTGCLLPILMPGSSDHIEYDPDQSYIVDDGEAMAELCADGLGLTQTPHFIARNWLQNQAIVSLFPAFNPEKFGIYILYPKHKYLPNRVKVFVDFLIEQMELLGETPLRTWARDIEFEH